MRSMLIGLLALALGSWAMAGGMLQYVTASSGGSYTIGSLPSVASGRYMPFTDAWTLTGGSNYTFLAANVGNWTASGVYFSTASGNFPDGGAYRVCLLRNIFGAFIQSPPLDGGVGTIYYTAKPRLPYHTQQVKIQISTSGVPSEDEWETVKTLDFPFVSPALNIADPVVLNRVDVRCVRFILTEESPYETSTLRTSGAVSFDNLVFSTPWTWIPNTGLWGPDFIEP